MRKWTNQQRSGNSILSEVPKVHIERTPPEDSGDQSIQTNYHAIVDELEQLYTGYVKNAISGNSTLRDALDGYDEKRDLLFAKLSEVFSERGLDSSGVGGMIQEHQDKLQNVAYAEIERLAEAAKQKKAMSDFLDKGI